jgi:putative two-component system response regulator
MKKEIVLLVDDVEQNRLVLKGILANDYEVIEAVNGNQAVEMMEPGGTRIPSILLLDLLMPVMDGYEVIRYMKSHVHTLGIPIIIISGADSTVHEGQALELGADDFIAKPFDPSVVRIRVDNLLRMKNYRDALESLVEKKIMQLAGTREKVLETMTNIIEYRNIESGHHVKRTRKLTEILIEHVRRHKEYGIEISPVDQEIYLEAVPLHDIGKIAIPDSILLKPSRLTVEEFEIVKTHASSGSEIIRLLLHDDNDIYLACCYDICRYHHERWDGQGYPDGLSGKDIPLSARFLAIVDVYDALVSSRAYKPPFTHKKAVEIISQGMNTQFDPMLVMAFLEVEAQFAAIK